VSHHLEMARKLLKAGAVCDIADPNGKTPSDWAKERQLSTQFDAMIQNYQHESVSKDSQVILLFPNDIEAQENS
jgi:ankyrin repeat protein